MPRKCHVWGCTSGATHIFKFPQPEKNKTRFLAWLAACGDTALLKVSQKNLKNRTICVCHFESKYVLPKKLSTVAVPTLHLPEKIDVSSYKFDDDKKSKTLAKRLNCKKPKTTNKRRKVSR